MVKQWQEISREWVYRKYLWNIQKRDYRLPDGNIADYYIRVAEPGACVLALTDDGRVVTVRQYRPGPNAILRELPGGVVEEGESPKAAGMRELLEETGFAGNAKWVGTWLDANTERTRYVVVATDCQKVGEQRLDHEEFPGVELVAVSDFVSQVRSGKLTDTAGAMLGLDFLRLLG